MHSREAQAGRKGALAEQVELQAAMTPTTGETGRDGAVPKSKAIYKLLLQSLDFVQPLLNHPAISRAEHVRLTNLCSQAIEKQTHRACVQYCLLAERLLKDAGVPEAKSAKFSGIMYDLSRLVEVPTDLPDPDEVSRPTGQDLLTRSIEALKLVSSHIDASDHDGDNALHVTNIEGAISKLVLFQATLPDPNPRPGTLASRIVLATPAGQLFDRGACPDQLWPTDNPLQAHNWPDLPTALAALTQRNYQVAYSKAKAAGYVLKRAVVTVEDLSTGEIEAAIGKLAGEVRAVAG